MKVFVFKAALVCESCGNAIKRNFEKPAHVNEADESSYDSDDWPKGPYSNGGGEADTPQHCDCCGVFLENPLTPEGDTYVRELAEPFDWPDASWAEVADCARQSGQPELAEWLEYYFAPGM